MHKHRFWRPTKGRSAAFQDYLRQQSPERQREILSGEQRFLYAVSNPIGTRVAAAVDFAQGLRGPTYQFPVSELLDRVR